MIAQPCLAASALLQQNVVALIEGSHSTVSACVLSTFTGIPLIRLHEDHDHWYKCEQAGVTMSAPSSNYAGATVKLLKTFHWTKVAVVYEGKTAGAYFIYSQFHDHAQ